MAFITPVVDHWVEREIAQWEEIKRSFTILLRQSIHEYQHILFTVIWKEGRKCFI